MPNEYQKSYSYPHDYNDEKKKAESKEDIGRNKHNRRAFYLLGCLGAFLVGIFVIPAVLFTVLEYNATSSRNENLRQRTTEIDEEEEIIMSVKGNTPPPPPAYMTEDEIMELDVPEPEVEAASEDEPSLQELLDKKIHENAVEQAKKAGVSTEGSTEEIMNRITKKMIQGMY